MIRLFILYTAIISFILGLYACLVEPFQLTIREWEVSSKKWIHKDSSNLVVSSGLGMTGLPLRFLTPPEITIVNISAER